MAFAELAGGVFAGAVHEGAKLLIGVEFGKKVWVMHK